MHILFSPQVSPPTTPAGYRARVFMGPLGLAVTDNCWGLHWGKWALPQTRLDKQTNKKMWTDPLTKQALMLDWQMKPCYLCRRCVAEKLLEEVVNVDFNSRFILFFPGCPWSGLSRADKLQWRSTNSVIVGLLLFFLQWANLTDWEMKTAPWVRVKRTVHSDLSSATAEHAQKPGDARHLLIRVSMVTKTLV